MPVTIKTDYRFIDVGVNLTDDVFRGKYHGKKRHDDDMHAILERARNAGVKSMILTGTSLCESQQVLTLAKDLGFFCTIGCHPTRSAEFETSDGGADAYLSALDALVANNLHGKGRVVAIGECGLDYDRTRFAMPEVQQKYFRLQLLLAKKHSLPLFLHSRAAHTDLVKILREEGFGEEGGKAVGGKGGVVHSFTGSLDEVSELMDMGFYISVNGCSLKNEENLRSAKAIHRNRVLLETDAPWCSMTGGHASKQHLALLPLSLRELYFPASTKPENFMLGKAIKGRNEPCAIGGVAWVMHELHGISLEEITESAFKNTLELFSLSPEELFTSTD
ncbi:Mg-dependent DNase [Mycena belliarum]|uniref:Mg-dependent DNase n=1 Tax=Mycena belliarum TaxID=1033014 RepID=A0AAD6XTE0_9AGAR|nr:Mg-dependent DNase [Mycena belliae]